MSEQNANNQIVQLAEQSADPEIEQRLDLEVNQVLPEEKSAYFADMGAKHFVPETAVGSLFTDVHDLRSLLRLAQTQRGGLAGDDREMFIALGAPEASMLPQCRYLKVETNGEVGIESVKELEPTTAVKVVRTKADAPCSLVIEKDEMPSISFGTIIIGPNGQLHPGDPEPSTSELVWTVHPGLPVRPAMGDIWEEGSEITVMDVVDKLGNDVYLNVRKTQLG